MIVGWAKISLFEQHDTSYVDENRIMQLSKKRFETRITGRFEPTTGPYLFLFLTILWDLYQVYKIHSNTVIDSLSAILRFFRKEYSCYLIILCVKFYCSKQKQTLWDAHCFQQHLFPKASLYNLSQAKQLGTKSSVTNSYIFFSFLYLLFYWVHYIVCSRKRLNTCMKYHINDICTIRSFYQNNWWSLQN